MPPAPSSTPSFRAPASIQKTVFGDAASRVGPISISLNCSDGTTATLTAPAGSTGPFALDTPILLREFPVQCTASETTTGAGSGVTVDTTHTVVIDNTAGETTTATSVTVNPEPGQHILINFADTYTAASTLPAADAASADAFAQSGSDNGELLRIGAALLLTGAGTILLGTRRRTHEDQA